ncbi:hypothetical protein [Tumebacillus flagellatus]|uniref:Uncharacterized protein n=1 Tax=Tumebacillus flagellatus TaxID=1157490 RepID=A0A074MDB9_9BACL|nr:hypothetical protein [Tumebacillus flagellatus]KEO83857.1 hypothetical protein EL26_08040 [Tumebacillus flagellatus]
MSLTLCFETTSFAQGAKLPDLHARLTELYEVSTSARLYGDEFFKCEDIYGIPFDGKTELADWMYDNSTGNNVGERKLLTQLIDRTPSMESSEYQTFCAEVGSGSSSQQVALVFLRIPHQQYALHVTTIHELIIAHRHYLINCPDIESFLEEVKLCFTNLFFHDNVADSLKTLSKPFEDYKYEIIRHLTALNDQFPFVVQQNPKQKMGVVLKAFQSLTQIAASMEGVGNKSSAAKRFEFEFKDADGTPVKIICEPHTKFELDMKQRFDRLYFFQGLPEIEEGKILIAHIGKHL